MKFEKNVGKKEGILRVIVGILLVILMAFSKGWLKWVSGLAGLSFIVTALAGT
jgi:hypothetical protein